MFHLVEQQIIERLTAGMPAGTRVLQHAEIDEAGDARQFAPYVAVIYDGYTPGQSVSPTGQVQQVSQEWYVVVGAKSAKKNGKDIAARDAAGELAEAVLELLLGLPLKNSAGKPSGAYLRLREAPGPEYEGGYCYLPLGFTSTATFKGNQ